MKETNKGEGKKNLQHSKTKGLHIKKRIKSTGRIEQQERNRMKAKRRVALQF